MSNLIMASLASSAQATAQREGRTDDAARYAHRVSRYGAQTNTSKPRRGQRDSATANQHQPKGAQSLLKPRLDVPMATQPQQDYIASLMRQLGETPTPEFLAGIRKCDVSGTLDRLKTQLANRPVPVKADAPIVDKETVLAARYYIADEDLKVKISHGEGKWAGWTFARNERTGENFRGAEAKRIIGLIASDPARYALAYGETFHRCANCHRELTNDVSVSIGMGPICRGYFGL